MEPEVRYTLVGGIVLALAAAAIAALVWLSGGASARNSRFYTINFERQSLEGLQAGSDVNMRGVKVGRVEAFSIGRDNINRVRVTIRVGGRTPVSENTRAVVARNILTGLARINLETPGTPGPELLAVPDGERHPVIPEGESGIDQIAESANRIAVSGEQALANLNRLMAEQNQRAFGEALAGLRDLSTGIASRLSALDAAADGLPPALRQAETLLRESTATVIELRAAIGSGRVAIGDAQVALRELARVSGALEQHAGALSRRADDAADAGVLELRASTQELRRAAESLTVAVERMAEPRAALLGPTRRELGPGEARR